MFSKIFGTTRSYSGPSSSEWSLSLSACTPRASNTVVFRHALISWEWGLIAGMTIVFIGAIELWKMLVRRRGWGAKYLSAPPAWQDKSAYSQSRADDEKTDEKRVGEVV
ncbi:hypothetical protein BDV93DRAFT_554207 [Ceratobasidium sp. AG-I]|nr:hypothetical protein BDV93DRAFT_554207 [Ceratobasidium sp. AG-I]